VPECSRSTPTPVPATGCRGGGPRPGLFPVFLARRARYAGPTGRTLALLSAVKRREVSEGGGHQRLSRSPHWVCRDRPGHQVLLTLEVGERTLAMAQGVVHQVVPGPGARLCAIVFSPMASRRMRRRADALGQWTQPPVVRPKGCPQAALEAAAPALSAQ